MGIMQRRRICLLRNTTRRKEKGMAKKRDYRLPDFSLDKRIKGLEAEEIKKYGEG